MLLHNRPASNKPVAIMWLSHALIPSPMKLKTKRTDFVVASESSIPTAAWPADDSQL